MQEAANAIEGTDSPEARILAATWRETLKEHTDGAEKVLRSMRGKMSSINRIANQNEAGRMNYADAIGGLSDRDRHHRGRGEDDRWDTNEARRIPLLAARRSIRHDLPSAVLSERFDAHRSLRDECPQSARMCLSLLH